MPATKHRYEKASGQILCPVQAEQIGQRGRTKQSFNTRITAQIVADGVNRRKQPARPLQPYLCQHCGWWHNGRLPHGMSDVSRLFMVVGEVQGHDPMLELRYRLGIGYGSDPLRLATDGLIEKALSDSGQYYGRCLTWQSKADHETLAGQLGIDPLDMWTCLVDVRPELWAVLWNLHLSSAPFQKVFRVSQVQPLVAQTWSQLPPYNVLWAAEGHA